MKCNSCKYAYVLDKKGWNDGIGCRLKKIEIPYFRKSCPKFEKREDCDIADGTNNYLGS
jgi:hypothetical protein